jgi:hypothetical protein
LSAGEFLNSQPEKILRQILSAPGLGGSSTKTCTKAPVSAGISQGAVRSQLCTRTTTLPICRRSPTLSTRSRVMLLRLLSSPRVAMRSLLGVTSPFSAAAASVGTGRGTAFAAGASSLAPSFCPHPASRARAAIAANVRFTAA